ncbi:hypothetical protein [Paraburkholderia sp. UCT31]|uniref:hypothetical protein n=1 Tax=Paraburkholderia sp. UCT31 TaxID=2615209 RepID=UPI0039771504
MSNLQLPPIFCWTRMGTESGEELVPIAKRKEWERQPGDGAFFRGIVQSLGNAPATAAEKLGSLAAVFSPMPSRPKAIDVTPGDVALWTARVAADGSVSPLPPHVLITSRATLPSGKRKLHHYALTCRADTPLTTHLDANVYPAFLTNHVLAAVGAFIASVPGISRRWLLLPAPASLVVNGCEKPTLNGGIDQKCGMVMLC